MAKKGNQESAKGKPGKCRSTARKAKYQRRRDRATDAVHQAKQLRKHLREQPNDKNAINTYNALREAFPLLRLAAL